MVEVKEETNCPTIEFAYDELTQEGFAVWIRMMMCTPEQLRSGKKELGKICNYSTNRFYNIMKELHNKDYIRYIKPDRLGKPHAVILQKRAMISGRNHFVRISGSPTAYSIRNSGAYLEKTYNTNGLSLSVNIDNIANEDCEESCDSGEDDYENRKHNPKRRNETLQLRNKLISKKGKRKTVIVDGEEINLQNLQKSASPSPLKPPIPNSKKPNKDLLPRATPFGSNLTKSSNITAREQNSGANKTKRETALSRKMVEKRKKVRDERTKQRKKEKEKRKKKKVLKIDYSKLDSKGDPSISFDPNSKRREELMAILSVKTKGRGVKKHLVLARKRTVNKLGFEFARIYKRYRNLSLKARGWKPTYLLPPGHDKCCNKIALQCIYHKITPRQLLEYWDAHLADFAKGTFPKDYPTLSFLTSIFASEQVESALYSSTIGGTNKWKSGDFHEAKNDRSRNHSFFNTEELDERLKEGLRNAGYLTSERYDDRYLLTVQKTAKAMARGKKVFVGGVLKKMVKWAVVNLYMECE